MTCTQWKCRAVVRAARSSHPQWLSPSHRRFRAISPLLRWYCYFAHGHCFSFMFVVAFCSYCFSLLCPSPLPHHHLLHHTSRPLNTVFIMRMSFTDMYWSVFTFQMLLCMFCTYRVFFLFLFCCNARAFVICAIKNYLLTDYKPCHCSSFRTCRSSRTLLTVFYTALCVLFAFLV